MGKIKEDIKEMKGERCRKIPRGFESEASPSYSHDGCGHSATHADPHFSLLPRFTARGMEEEDAPKEETLSDYLQEYESHSWRFKDNLDFQGFFQVKEDRRSNNHDRSKRDRIFLSNFDRSAECIAKAWVEEIFGNMTQCVVLDGNLLDEVVLDGN